jgi:hypothetical protein
MALRFNDSTNNSDERPAATWLVVGWRAMREPEQFQEARGYGSKNLLVW